MPARGLIVPGVDGSVGGVGALKRRLADIEDQVGSFGDTPVTSRLNSLEAADIALDARLDALEAGDTSWHVIGATGEPAFTNGWVNFAPGFPNASYRKDASGRVWLRGIVKDGTVGGLPMFTLPAGYRPPENLHFATVANDAFAELRVGANGEVCIFVGSNVWASITPGVFWTV